MVSGEKNLRTACFNSFCRGGNAAISNAWACRNLQASRDPGQGERVTLHVSSRELSYWSTQAQNWMLGVGPRNVYVGASSRDIRLHGSAQVEQENDHKKDHGH